MTWTPQHQRFKMKMKVAAAALLAFSLLSSTFAQNPSPPAEKQDKKGQEDVVSITSNLVQIDVVVTDKDGKQVNDLRPDEFEISEDGNRQWTTTSPSFSGGGAQPAPAAGEAAKNDTTTMPPARLTREQVR